MTADPDVNPLLTDIAALRREVAELRDREAIRAVLDTYAFLLDTAQWRDIPAAVFTEDAVDHHSPHVGPSAEPHGREEIGRFLDDTMRTYAGSQHLLGNSMIQVDGDSAHSRTYAICSHWSDRGPAPSDLMLAVAYDDSWRRTREGWRVCERRVHTFGPHGLLAGHRSAHLARLGADLYGSRDR